jgi:hypothetical protein
MSSVLIIEKSVTTNFSQDDFLPDMEALPESLANKLEMKRANADVPGLTWATLSDPKDEAKPRRKDSDFRKLCRLSERTMDEMIMKPNIARAGRLHDFILSSMDHFLLHEVSDMNITRVVRSTRSVWKELQKLTRENMVMDCQMKFLRI